MSAYFKFDNNKSKLFVFQELRFIIKKCWGVKWM